MAKISITGMIYKSIDYLRFMVDQTNRFSINDNKIGEVELVVIANDASLPVLHEIEKLNIKSLIYKDPKPHDYYMNRIYRAWNYGGMNVDGDIIVFINSDMAFSNGWLYRLLTHLSDSTIPCARLVESGKMRSGRYGVGMDFGRRPSEFNEKGFLKYAQDISAAEVHNGGLFMPCAFFKKDFIESGGYPEGNVYVDGVGAYGSKLIDTGDNYFFYKNPVMKKKKHITVFDSIVYHIQEGELDA